MRIWTLSPLDTSARDWEASTYRGVAIVRAKNEDEAQQPQPLDNGRRKGD
jgi:hypothetical protein